MRPVPCLVLAAASSLAALTPSTASAYWYVGNPELSVRVTWPNGDLDDGLAQLDFVRVFVCGGGYTDYPIDAWIDPATGWSTEIAGGDLCGIGLRWSSDVFVQSTGDFVLRYEELATGFTLSSSGVGTAAFSPFVVASGSFSGPDPEFVVTLQ